MFRTAKLALVAAALSTTALSPLAAAATQAKAKPRPAAAAPQTSAIAVPPIVYRQRVLPNGLKVLTSRDATTPNVSVQVWYGVGSKDDPHGRSGFAHLFEHLMFRPRATCPTKRWTA
jgi:zinc protease